MDLYADTEGSLLCRNDLHSRRLGRNEYGTIWEGENNAFPHYLGCRCDDATWLDNYGERVSKSSLPSVSRRVYV